MIHELTYEIIGFNCYSFFMALLVAFAKKSSLLLLLNLIGNCSSTVACVSNCS